MLITNNQVSIYAYNICIMLFVDNELWICKPVSLNQGKGIYLIRNPEMLRQKLEMSEDGQHKRYGFSRPIGRIIQK
jgi:hypothetical protein